MAATRSKRSAGAGLLAAIAIAGCGSGGHIGGHLNFKGRHHPPGTVSVSIALSRSQVVVFPAKLGAGPIIFNVVNTTGSSESVSVRRASRSGHRLVVVASGGPIAPGGSFQVKANVLQGDYAVVTAPHQTTLATAASAPRAMLDVGPSRGGGNDLIDQP